MKAISLAYDEGSDFADVSNEIEKIATAVSMQSAAARETTWKDVVDEWVNGLGERATG
jgi:hypothetical protein